MQSLKESPAKALEDAPAFGKSGVHAHINWTGQAVQAGILYFMTGDEDFAIIRTIKSDAGSELVLYIGDGEKLSFKGHELLGREGRKGSKGIRL